MDKLTEDNAIPKELDEIVRSSSRVEGGVARGDDFELAEPGDALLPERVHDVD